MTEVSDEYNNIYQIQIRLRSRSRLFKIPLSQLSLVNRQRYSQFLLNTAHSQCGLSDADVRRSKPGTEKRERRRPTVRRKACTVRSGTQGSRSSNSQSNPCNCASGSSAGGSRTPTWENWTGRDQRPSSPFAQEDESRPFQLTGRTALQIVSFQRATTWLPWPKARGTCRQRTFGRLAQTLAMA